MRRLVVDLPDGWWVEAPHEAAEVTAWASEVASAIGGASAGSLADELTALATRAVAAEPLAYAVLLSNDGAPRVEALLFVDQVLVSDDPDEVRRELVAADAGRDDVVSGPHLCVVELPLGNALRTHRVLAVGGGTVVESIEHVVPLDEGVALRAELTWIALATGEELVELADAVARGLRLEPDPSA